MRMLLRCLDIFDEAFVATLSVVVFQSPSSEQQLSLEIRGTAS